MRKYTANIVTILACYVASVLGANAPPSLSGLGKIIFNSSSPAPTISDSSGTLTFTAGASNQGLTFNSTGTGQHAFQLQGNAAAFITDNGHSPEAGFYVTRNNTGALSLITQNTDNETLLFDGHRNSGGFVADGTSAARLIKTSAKLFFSGATGLTAGNNFTFGTNAGAIDLSNSNWGFGGNTSPSYAVDATGDINASGAFRAGGTNVGQTTTVLTMVKGTPAASQSNCTLIFTGGIRTGGTC